MALIDLSELMADVDFSDQFVVIRRQQNIDNFGRVSSTQTSFQAVGSVQSPTADQLTLLPESTRNTGNVTIYTMFPLQSVTATTAADIVQWAGLNYIVFSTQSWANWGAGFYQATCYQYDLLSVNNDPQ